MLGKRSAQRGLFEADTRYGEFVGQRTFYGYLASQRDELFGDEDFAALYSPDRGRPSVPPSLLATALVLQTYDGVSDEEAKQRADYDLRWKVALGLEVETRPFAKSTLQEFRAQLILHDQTRALFQRSLEMAKRRGVWKKGKAPDERQHIKLALDTTYILGRGAVRDTYNLLADGIVQVLRGLARLVGCELQEVAEELGCARYIQGPSLKGQADVDWTDPQARQRFLAEIVADAEHLLEVVRGTRSDLTAGSQQDQELVVAAELLARILAQDIERDDRGPRLKRGVAPDRLISVHDPEMRHGRKSSSHRFNGHKAQVAVDTDTQMITAVDVLAGNAPDAEQALEVVEASEVATGCQVAEVMGDCAYGAGETRAEFAAAGRTLIAKVPDLQNQGYFAKTDFYLDLEAGTCSCPNQQQTRDFHAAKGGGGMFVFATETCAACPLRASCTRGQGGRTVQVHPQEALLQQARALQRSPVFGDVRRRRQVVEHRIARLVQLGIRQARSIGRTRTLFQLCIAAAVANLTLLATTSDAVTVDHLCFMMSLLVALAAMLSLIVGPATTILRLADPPGHHSLLHLAVPLIRPLQGRFSAGFLGQSQQSREAEEAVPPSTSIGVDAQAKSAASWQGSPMLQRLRAAQIRVRCFGAREVWCGDRQLFLADPELLLLLAAHPITGIQGEALADMLWEEEPIVDPSRALRKRRQRLRDELRRLAPEVTAEPLPQDMKHGQRIVTLNPDVVASDVQEFLELLNSARTLEPADAIRAYEAALALYRGDLLDAADMPHFRWMFDGAQIALTLRSDYQLRQRETRLLLADLLAAGDEAALARSAELYLSLCAETPEDERLWTALFRVHERAGSLLGLQGAERRLRAALAELAPGDVDVDTVLLPPKLGRLLQEIRLRIGGPRPQGPGAGSRDPSSERRS